MMRYGLTTLLILSILRIISNNKGGKEERNV